MAPARQIAATILSGLVVVGLGACGSSPPSACLTPDTEPRELASHNATDPVVATGATGSAVAAWSSLTGTPVSVRVRDTGLQWGSVHTIGDYRTRNPDVAMASDGQPWVAFEGFDDDRAAVFAASGPDWTPDLISRGQANAQEPQIAVAGEGTVIAAWITFVNGTQGAIAVSVHGPDGWSAPAMVASATSRVEHLSLSAATDGSAVLAWTGGGGRAWATARQPNGRWSPAATVSSGDREAIEPAVAAGSAGEGWVVWNEAKRDGTAARVVIRRFRAGSWDAPTTLDTASQGPLQMPRPGQALLGPALAMTHDGALTATWAVGSRRRSQVRARTFTPRRGWAPTVTLSDPADHAGAPAVAIGPEGRPIVAWEEVDHNLLRTRSRTLGGGERCTDLIGAVTESSAIALAGGTHPVAVFIDLRRASVDVQDLR